MPVDALYGCTRHNVGSLFTKTCPNESTDLIVRTDDDAYTSFLRIFDSVRNAALPVNYDSIIAITAAEAASGIIGGLASRKVAELIGDEKRDQTTTKIGK